tara:strand:- start:845 stop:1051 length:207 start_codon:yes stop_codon:yes gene_type:complete
MPFVIRLRIFRSFDLRTTVDITHSFLTGQTVCSFCFFCFEIFAAIFVPRLSFARKRFVSLRHLFDARL